MKWTVILLSLPFPLLAGHKFTSSCLNTQKVAIANDSADHGIEWSGAEHKQLGDLGFLAACEELGINNPFCLDEKIERKDGKLKMSYGQLLAMGDFYLHADDSYNEKRRLRSISKIFKCIDKEGKVHGEQRDTPEVDYPSCTWTNVLHGGKYLKVVRRNYDHFAWDNMKAYIRFHEMALDYAIQARNQKKESKKKKLLNRALYYNGFADHFLTDAFPAGHLRVPRLDIKRWVKANYGSILKSSIGDALAMLLHDFEGKDLDGNELGMPVKNSLGFAWTTRSDNSLNSCATDRDLHIKMPTLAVKASNIELWTAFYKGIKPKGVFEATRYVPYPNDLGLVNRWAGLIEGEQGERNLSKIRSDLSFPANLILKKKHIRRLFKHLPEVMAQFRDRIEFDLTQDPSLRDKLPSRYIEGFRNLR
ncbi:MAG: hypothetical protein AB8E15_10640 [Bdellovibrionales bacterium]